MYLYKFSKSITKLGLETTFTETELKKMLNYSYKIIE